MATIVNTRVGRRIYLATYSQADSKRFPTRESFGKMLEEEFNRGAGKVKVLHWACSKESHTESGFHYHCCLKLSGVKKWSGVSKNIIKNHGIVVSFSDSHDYYASAFHYVTKEDQYFILSDDHPDLSEVGSPRTKACTQAYRAKRKRVAESQETPTPASKKLRYDDKSGPSKAGTSRSSLLTSPINKKLTNIEVGDYVIKNNIKTITEIFAAAEKRKEEGQCDLAMYLFTRSEKFVKELIGKSWLLKQANSLLLEDEKSRIDMLRDAKNTPCHPQCNWLEAALQVLSFNKIDRTFFTESIRDLIENGRGKFRNIMLTGRSNCAKTFMLKPLKEIFKDKVFENPSRDKFGWIGADKAKIMLLQDFRYCKDLISWNDFLLLLEGETVKLPSPKNHFVEDIVIKATNSIPIFATSKSKIEFSKFSSDYFIETEMMNSRWNVITFTHVFPQEEQKDIKPCGHCFARLVLEE